MRGQPERGIEDSGAGLLAFVGGFEGAGVGVQVGASKKIERSFYFAEGQGRGAWICGGFLECGAYRNHG
jgi:hypothetical protein